MRTRIRRLPYVAARDNDPPEPPAEEVTSSYDAGVRLEPTPGSSEAFDRALEELEDSMRVDASPSKDAESSLKSQSLRDLEALAQEARSFVRGVREEVERLQGNVVERLKVEARAVVSIADFVLRRALLDTARVLASATGTFKALGAAPASTAAEQQEEATPFATRLRKAELRDPNALPPAEDVEAWSRDEARQREGAAEAAQLAQEALVVATDTVSRGAEMLLVEIASGGEGREWAARAARALAVRRAESGPLPDPDVMQQRTRTVQEALRAAFVAAAATTRADYGSYLELQRRQQLLTFTEELEELGVQLPAGQAVLSSLQSVDATAKRRDDELARQQFRLAAALATRGVKDSGDALVFGVLPAVTAAGKVAARRITEPFALRPAEPRQGKSGTAGLVLEYAQQLSEEYVRASQRGVAAGLLPDLLTPPTSDFWNEDRSGAKAREPALAAETVQELITRAKTLAQVPPVDSGQIADILPQKDFWKDDAAQIAEMEIPPVEDFWKDDVVDVAVVESEEVRDLTQQLLGAVDVTVLAAEVLAAKLADSPALDMARAYIAARDEASPGREKWEVLKSLNRNKQKRRQRNAKAERDLLDAFLRIVERK